MGRCDGVWRGEIMRAARGGAYVEVCEAGGLVVELVEVWSFEHVFW